MFVDRIITNTSLSMIDMDDPDVSLYRNRSIPVVALPSGYQFPPQCSCVCSAISTGTRTPPPLPNGLPERFSFNFAFNPPWDPNWTIQERRAEECRRVCWSALNLVANYTAQCAAFHQEPVELRLMEPANVSTLLRLIGSVTEPQRRKQICLLFPGEAYERRHPIAGQSPKDSVWALYCRSMLLWVSCVRQRDASWGTEERARFAIDAWNEITYVQSALDMHACNIDTAIMYMCREYLYKYVSIVSLLCMTY